MALGLKLVIKMHKIGNKIDHLRIVARRGTKPQRKNFKAQKSLERLTNGKSKSKVRRQNIRKVPMSYQTVIRRGRRVRLLW